MSTVPTPGVEPVAMPDEIKVRFSARKQQHPSNVIWAMFDGENWYVYAHTSGVAKLRMNNALHNGFHIFTEVAP